MSETRPFVVMLASTSMDGRMALGPNRTWWDDMADARLKPNREHDAIWQEARENITRLHHPQGDMQGSGSFVAEGAPLTPLPPFEGDTGALYAHFLPEEVLNRPEPRSWLIVVDGRGRLRSGYKGTEHPGCHMLHLTSPAAPPEYLAFLRRERLPYLLTGQDRVDLPAALGLLRAALGVERLISSGGGGLSGALLRAGLLDEINLILRPEVIGGSLTPALFDGPDLAPHEWPTALRLISAQVHAGAYVWLRYEVLPPSI